MNVGKFIVLLIIGSLAGSVAGRLVTFSKHGYGRWINMVVGICGALVGESLFRVLGIDLGLSELKISLEDLIAAFSGSLLCIFIAWLVRRFAVGAQKPSPGGSPSPR
jgi:uncharacterized membrane protein YeaQ/YmgE (transglycosylase-associated protein family)